MNPLFQIPEDLAALSVEELTDLVTSFQTTVEAVVANPAEYVSDERTTSALMDEMQAGVAAIEAARAELAERSVEPVEPAVDAPEAELELDPAALEELAARARADEPDETEEPETADDPIEPEGAAATDPVEPVEPEALATEPVEPTEPEPAEEPAEPVVAAAPPAPAKPARRAALARPSRSRASRPQATAAGIALTAAAEGLGFGLGQEIDAADIADMMIRRRGQFGDEGEGTHGLKVPIVKADWRDQYPEERTFSGHAASDMAKVEAVTAAAAIREAFEARRREAPEALTASGGLCAPVTPYYGLQMLSVADRPVRAALPAFNADRGGILAARPAALTAIGDAVGIITEAEDALGGSSATKTCQVIDCPPFTETDVDTIYHCLQFGNLGARTFPELVTQWNALVLAAHARKADTHLLDGIGGASTTVTASDLGLGASSTIPSQILAAANGMRSRHRMRPETVLRVMLPFWVLDLLVSDMYRSQFQRFDMDASSFVRVLRDANVEPSFYLDEETGAGQVFAAQGAGALLAFPPEVVWYLYPEGSFLYLDGGTLELGLVRDSILNSTNDWQVFGETFENVAFIGIESLKVSTTVCDSGAVSAPAEITACGDYS